jgi:hypothetical protein
MQPFGKKSEAPPRVRPQACQMPKYATTPSIATASTVQMNRLDYFESLSFWSWTATVGSKGTDCLGPLHCGGGDCGALQHHMLEGGERGAEESAKEVENAPSDGTHGLK